MYPILGMFCAMMILSSCGDDDTTESFSLSIAGLEDLGSAYQYEGWIIVDGSPVTTGLFSVDADGNLSKSSFDVEAADLEAASTFVLTIEPSPDSDPAPSDTHVLAGDFSGNTASLTVGHGAALGNDFSSSAGTYILATPTDDVDTNEDSGVWFLDNSSGSPMAGLDPASLLGGTAVISIEPSPDNSTAPFTFKPLVHNIPSNAATHSAIQMDQNLSFPSGTVSR